jgi:hypothetical protein
MIPACLYTADYISAAVAPLEQQQLYQVQAEVVHVVYWQLRGACTVLLIICSATSRICVACAIFTPIALIACLLRTN